MAKVFLDSNAFIGLIEKRGDLDISLFTSDTLYVSVESLTVWLCLYKHKIPGEAHLKLFSQFNFVDSTSDIAKRSFQGPTNDFEDNSKLHSAVAADCDVFFTLDKGLLKLGYFGKLRICATL